MVVFGDMRVLSFLAVATALVASLACFGQSPVAAPVATPTDVPDLEATVQAAVSAAPPTETPTRQPDIGATIAAGIEGTRAAEPSPTPDINATVEARMAATIAAQPTLTGAPVTAPEPMRPPTGGEGPTSVPTRDTSPMPTSTPAPTATPRPTPTPTQRPTSTPVSVRTASMTLSDMVNQVRPAVVRIGTTTSVGTGVIFETTGQTAYVVTNEHVISGHREVTVVVNDSDRYRGTVLGSDSVRDLAVVSICCGRFQPLPFGDAAGLRAGDEVIAIGYALGLSGQASITRGIVSAIRYDSNHLSDVIQTDAAINPGNSGGPMLSMSGEILGINTFSIDQAGSGRPAEGLGFAVSGTTVQNQIPRLRTAAANPSPTPIARSQPTSTPRLGQEGEEGYVFGPVSGGLRHDPRDGLAESFSADVSMMDVAVSATFSNPFSAASGSWDYGFAIRESAGQARVQAVVTSAGRWEAQAGTSSSNMKKTGGTLPSFNSGAGQRNTVVLFAVGEWGMLFVNGEFISLLDLSALTRAGDVSVITGAFTGNEKSGASTGYESFQAIQMYKRFGPSSGTLRGEANRVTEHNTGLWTSNLVAEAEFVNPAGSNWDYGFVFRNPDVTRLEVVGVTGDGKWFHNARSAQSGVYVDVAEGDIPGARAGFQGRNHVMLLAFGGTGLYLLNGQVVARLDLSHNQDSGGVSALSNFFAGHQGSPSFSKFNVWTP